MTQTSDTTGGAQPRRNRESESHYTGLMSLVGFPPCTCTLKAQKDMTRHRWHSTVTTNPTKNNCWGLLRAISTHCRSISHCVDCLPITIPTVSSAVVSCPCGGPSQTLIPHHPFGLQKVWGQGSSAGVCVGGGGGASPGGGTAQTPASLSRGAQKDKGVGGGGPPFAYYCKGIVLMSVIRTAEMYVAVQRTNHHPN